MTTWDACATHTRALAVFGHPANAEIAHPLGSGPETPNPTVPCLSLGPCN